MLLEQYPRAIYKQEILILQNQENVDLAKEIISYLDAEIEEAIANDSTLKNEQQRKAKKAELKKEQDYLTATAQLKSQKAELTKAEIELNRLRNEFSVKKLNKREAIAQLTAGELTA